MGLVAAVFPVAAVGTLIHWVPYRLAGIVAARVEQNPDLPATFKLMASMFFFPVTWALVAFGVGRVAGFWPGVVALLVAPATGWFALLFHERHASFWARRSPPSSTRRTLPGSEPAPSAGKCPSSSAGELPRSCR